MSAFLESLKLLSDPTRLRILLIGATGFIGSEIARALVRDGHDVT